MPVAKLTASNLTSGRNGAGAVYSEADWVRSIRRGVDPEGKPLVPLLPAELIDHADRDFTQPDAGVSEEYGRYLATSCTGCHGEGYSGGKIPGVPPDWPVAANLTPDSSGLGTWTEEQFKTFLMTGARPDGRLVDAQYMPWPLGAAMTDDERSALWVFFRSLPATPQGESLRDHAA
jgi:mono/diheme cytochrome c family protein